jgi:tetratricopeptide (TPR) repeat protein
MAERKWLDVMDVCDTVLALESGNATAASRRAWAEYNLGRYEVAAAAYRALLDHYPGDVDLQAGLGWSLLKQGLVGEARTELEAVLRLAPDHASAGQGLAAIADHDR